MDGSAAILLGDIIAASSFWLCECFVGDACIILVISYHHVKKREATAALGIRTELGVRNSSHGGRETSRERLRLRNGTDLARHRRDGLEDAAVVELRAEHRAGHLPRGGEEGRVVVRRGG